jgi:hypothetical protein
MTGVFCLFATGSAVGAEAIKLNPSVEQSLRQHPNVAEAKARVCQAIHRLGLDKARARPQVSLSISGGRQLIERVKGANGRPDDRGSAQSGYIVIRSGLRVRARRLMMMIFRVPIARLQASGAWCGRACHIIGQCAAI